MLITLTKSIMSDPNEKGISVTLSCSKVEKYMSQLCMKKFWKDMQILKNQHSVDRLKKVR